MQVEFKEMPIIKRWATRKGVYELKQDSGFERVLVDGDQVGLVPNNEADPNYRVLHPLSLPKGFPIEFLELVVQNSNGRLTSTLNGPVTMEDEPEGEEYDDESEG